MFFCLKGPSFNGNQFAKEALEKGALWVVADEAEYATDPRIILTANALAALQKLAAFHRKTLNTKIIAIGGSNGKTTTKELCLSVFGKNHKAKATAGNLNNHIGVPLTLLALDGTQDFAIIETGTNHIGEMKVLCNIVEPDLGIVTNVGKEHLEGFGTLEAVAREESELYLNLIQNNGLALVNNDDSWLHNMSVRLPNKFTYGINSPADLQATIVASMPLLQFNLHYEGKTYGPFHSQIGGEYNMYNILAAIAAGIQLGLDLETSTQAACEYSPKNNRSEWRQIGQKQIWLDAYNANPSSVEVALESFAKLPGQKAICLGDMLELGSHSQSEHLEIFNKAKSLGFTEIYLCGIEFGRSVGNYPHHFSDSQALADWLFKNPSSAEYILVKGSRGSKMEVVLEAFH